VRDGSVPGLRPDTSKSRQSTVTTKGRAGSSAHELARAASRPAPSTLSIDPTALSDLAGWVWQLRERYPDRIYTARLQFPVKKIMRKLRRAADRWGFGIRWHQDSSVSPLALRFELIPRQLLTSQEPTLARDRAALPVRKTMAKPSTQSQGRKKREMWTIYDPDLPPTRSKTLHPPRPSDRHSPQELPEGLRRLLPKQTYDTVPG
jgi:hypothetical protein